MVFKSHLKENSALYLNYTKPTQTENELLVKTTFCSANLQAFMFTSRFPVLKLSENHSRKSSLSTTVPTPSLVTCLWYIITAKGHLMAITRYGINRQEVGALKSCLPKETVSCLHSPFESIHKHIDLINYLVPIPEKAYLVRDTYRMRALSKENNS